MITYIQQNSVVGMLLGHREKYVVIRSMQEGLMQHDVYSWEVLGPSLIHEDGITDECRVLNASLKEWIDNMDYDQRRQFVNSLFDLLDECDAKTTDDLQNNWYKDIGRILTSIKKMDEASRKVVSQTILSLLVGLWVGTTIVCGWNPIEGLPTMISDYFIPQVGNEGNAGMLMLITACGGFVYMFKASGAGKAFGDMITGTVKTRKSAQLLTYFGAFAFIFTEPTLTLGSVMRPITERLRVSRVKLAYICDVMGCPFATLSPITSYSSYATGLIAAGFTALAITDNAWMTFIKAIPFNFYALFGMLALLFVIIAGVDIGPMYEAEKRAVETGQLIGENDVPMTKYDLDEEAMFAGKNITKLNFLLPLGALFFTLLAMIMWTGDAGTNGVGGAFRNCNITLSISLAFLIGAFASGICGARSKIFGFKDIMGQITHGIALNTDIPLILVLAWSVGVVTVTMDLKGYIVHLVEVSNIAPGIMPIKTPNPDERKMVNAMRRSVCQGSNRLPIATFAP